MLPSPHIPNRLSCFRLRANMDFFKAVIYLGTLMMITSGQEDWEFGGRAENVQWVSFNFKTLLTWTSPSSDNTYSVQYSMEGDDWQGTHCIGTSETECDMTTYLEPLDRAWTADIKKESLDGYDDDLPHTESEEFNPYKESHITAVSFSAESTADNSVILNISDPITSLHDSHGQQLTIRDILKQDLKYKINYNKAGSTGKKEHISDSSIAEVPNLDPGQGYCFSVAAYIPSRPKQSQLGEWSMQQCTSTDSLGELNIGLLLGVIFILLIIVIIIILTVAFLCCRRAPQQTRLPEHQLPERTAQGQVV